jgi:hypothetical protein
MSAGETDVLENAAKAEQESALSNPAMQPGHTNGQARPAETVGQQTTKRRGWDDVSREEFHAHKKLKDGDSDGEKEDRKPKRKVACMIGYCGTGYSGMQFNTPHKTIEGTLFEAFVKAKAISSDNADDPKKVQYRIRDFSLMNRCPC